MANTRSRHSREKLAEPTRREVLALAFLADVDPRKARRALIEGAGVIQGDDGHRIAIALDAMGGLARRAS